MTRASTPPEERCSSCDGWGFFVASRDPDIEDECGHCRGTGRKTMTLSTEHLTHTADPAVSRDAAAGVDTNDTETVMHAIIDLLVERGPLAPWELEGVYHSHRDRRQWPLVAPYSVHRRASHMKRQVGVLHGTGVRVAPISGKPAERLALSTEATAAHASVRRYARGDR